MTIKVSCSNGHSLNAQDSLAGKSVRCPKCGVNVTIPDTIVIVEEVDIIEAEEVEDGTSDLFGGAFEHASSSSVPAGFDESPEKDPFAFSFSNSSPASLESVSYLPNSSRMPASKAVAEASDEKLSVRTLVWGVAGIVLVTLVLGSAWVTFLFTSGVLYQKGPRYYSNNDGSAGGVPNTTGSTSSVSPATRERRVQGSHKYTLKADEDVVDLKAIKGSASRTLGSDEEFRKILQPGSIVAPDYRNFGRSHTFENVRPELTEPSVESIGSDLKLAQKSRNLIEVDLPDFPWRAAYDPNGGTLLMSNDQHGFLAYSASSLAAKKIVPVRSYAVNGLPSAVCYKPSKDRNLFVFTGSHDDVLYVVDAATGEPVSRIQVQTGSSIVSLASSSNVNDPYVYVLSHVQQTAISGQAGILGRIDLETGSQSYAVTYFYGYLAVSPNGERIAVSNRNVALVGDWKCLSQLKQVAGQLVDPSGDLVLVDGEDNFGFPTFFGSMLGCGKHLYDAQSKYPIDHTAFVPLGGFTESPIVVGFTSDKKICFASARDRYIKELFDVSHIEMCNTDYEGKDFRSFGGRKSKPGKALVHTFCDDNRGFALVLEDRKLFVARVDENLWKDEKASSPVITDIPPINLVGVPISQPLNLDGELVELIRFRAQPQPLNTPPALASIREEDSPSPLAKLASYLGVDSDKFTVDGDIDSVAKARNILVDLEMMEVVSVSGAEVTVKRTRPTQHFMNAFVFPVDEKGKSITVYPRKAASSRTRFRLELIAAVNPTQDEIFVHNINSIGDLVLPIEIKIGEEKMAIVDIDTFRDSVKVKRTSGKYHEVSTPIKLVETNSPPNGSEVTDGSEVPELVDGLLKWTPSSSQLGMQWLRLRIVKDGVCREEIHGFNVGIPTFKAEDFTILGIEPDTANSNLAVVWGSTSVSKESILIGDENAVSGTTVPFIGVYDFEKKELLRNRVLPNWVDSAAIHGSSIHLSMLRIPENRIDQYRQAEKVQSFIIALDSESLNARDFALVDGRCKRMRTIGGKYLGVLVNDGESFGFNLDDLTRVVEPRTRDSEKICTFGRIGKNWVWDGVLYDEQFSKPQLLILANSFRDPAHSIDRTTGFLISANAGQYISIMPNCNGYSSGFYARALPGHREDTSGTELQNLPAHMFSSSSGALFFRTNELIKKALANDLTFPHAFMPLLPTSALRDPQSGQAIMTGNSWVSAFDGHLYTAREGRVLKIPDSEIRDLLGNPTELRIEHRQDQFNLKFDGINTLRYRAAGATKFTLRLYLNPIEDMQITALEHPGVQVDTPLMMESRDGEFQVQLQPYDVAQRARWLIGGDTSRPPTKAEIDKCIESYSEPYERLTGEKLNHIPVPYYAVVCAERDDLPNVKAYMVHAYLVEVPINAFVISQ